MITEVRLPIIPCFSAKSMNMEGGIIPLTGCCQRARASTPTKALNPRLILG